MKHWLLAIFIALIVIALFGGYFFNFSLQKIFLSFPNQQDNAGDLKLENELLKSELAKFESAEEVSPGRNSYSLTAFVYSRYPFNLKSEFLIDAGKNQGVFAGDAAVLKGVLIGKVGEVFDNKAVIYTVFDKRFQTAARIGRKGIDALFTGGNEPKLTLISKKADFQIGDAVYTASSDFRYGLPIGEVAGSQVSSDKVFKEAEVKLDYDLNGIKAVSIISHP